MKDFSILPKEVSCEKRKKCLSLSLAFRVFFASLLFLVVPLLFHGYFNYQHRYQQQVKDILITLGFFSEGRAHFIQRTIEGQKEILDLVTRSLPWEESQEALSAKWKAWCPFGKPAFSDVFYLVFDHKEWRCLFSSDPSMEGIAFPDNSSFQKAFSEDSFAFFGQALGKDHLYVTQTIVLEGKPKGLLVSISPADVLIERLKISTPQFYDLDISFLDKEGNILLTSSPLLKGKVLQKDAFLKPVKGTSEGYILETEQMDFLANEETLAMPEGSLLAMIEEDSFSDLHFKRYWAEVFLLLFSFFVIGGGIALLIILRMSRPLRSLYSTMERVAKGEQTARYLHDFWGFEINSLGKSFNHMIDEVIEHQKKEEEERLQKEIYQNELKIGKEIQESLIVSHLPHVDALDVATSYFPAKEVGGDFYDLFQKGDAIFFGIADTSGKGISACLYSLSIRSMIRSFAQKSSDLSAIFSQTNQLFCEDSQDSGIFVTLWMGCYEPKKKLLHYASAGHYPVFLKKRDQTITPLQTAAMALGVEKENSFPYQTVLLEKGDLLFLYTDGILDAMSSEQKAFGKKRLEKFLLDHDKKTAEEWSTALIQEVAQFTKSMEQYDDMTLMVVRIR